MTERIVRRVRTLTYIGTESWVRATTENINRYVNVVREFPQPNNLYPRLSIFEWLGPIEEETARAAAGIQETPNG